MEIREQYIEIDSYLGCSWVNNIYLPISPLVPTHYIDSVSQHVGITTLCEGNHFREYKIDELWECFPL